jgi:glycerol uptake facilitator-like aquaporin
MLFGGCVPLVALSPLGRISGAHMNPAVTLAFTAPLTWQGSPFTGTSLNPARSAGPALAFADLADLWAYFPAPVAGALLAAGVTRPAAA